MTLELIDSFENRPGKDWSCVTLSFSTISPSSVIVFCATMPCGATSALMICVANEGGSGKDQPWITSADMCFASDDASFADLWFLYSKAWCKSCCLMLSLMGWRGNSVPRSIICFVFDQIGCRCMSISRACVGLNSEPYAIGVLFWALKAAAMLPCDLITLMLCSAASIVGWKENCGAWSGGSSYASTSSIALISQK